MILDKPMKVEQSTIVRASYGILLALAMLMIVGCEMPQADRFEPIRLMVCQGKYEQAIPLLKSYSGAHELRASFFLAKAYLGTGETEKALRAFVDTIERFPGTDKAHKSRYKIGVIHFVDGNLKEAKQQFQKLADRSDGPLAPESKFMLKLFDE